MINYTIFYFHCILHKRLWTTFLSIVGQALRFLKLDVNEKDADDLFRRFEKERTGTIDYAGFLQLLGFDSKLAARRAEKNADDEVLDALINRIRLKIEDNLGNEAQSSKRVKEVLHFYLLDIRADFESLLNYYSHIKWSCTAAGFRRHRRWPLWQHR